jgi:hypothetical protein
LSCKLVEPRLYEVVDWCVVQKLRSNKDIFEVQPRLHKFHSKTASQRIAMRGGPHTTYQLSDEMLRSTICISRLPS